MPGVNSLKPKSYKAKKTGKADVVLNLIQKLYVAESRIKDKSSDDKYAARHEFSLPILKKLKMGLNRTHGKTVFYRSKELVISQMQQQLSAIIIV
jgi:hypothetical protein